LPRFKFNCALRMGDVGSSTDSVVGVESAMATDVAWVRTSHELAVKYFYRGLLARVKLWLKALDVC